MSLVSLVYVSLASHDMTDQELKDILEVSRDNNHALNVTGMLLYRDGFFIQALEGERNVVDNLYDKIEKDRRHTNVLKVYENDIEARSFNDWSMGFNKISDEAVASEEGFSEFLEDPEGRMTYFTGKPTRAVRLLNRFKDRTYF
jgi:hypothetical protein